MNGTDMPPKAIKLDHGCGMGASHELLKEIILPSLGLPPLGESHDSAVLRPNGGGRDEGFRDIAFTTDSYVISPIFFPGGDIGSLAVCGTVNDLSVSGAVPEFIGLGLIMEEGFPIGDLKKILASVNDTCREVGVRVVTGDTKVVESGGLGGNGIVMNTSGIGYMRPELKLHFGRVRAGDRIIVSGTIGDHETAVLLARGEWPMKADIMSDMRPLNRCIGRISKYGEGIRFMRDLTRGGLGTVLWELAEGMDNGIGLEISEERIPIRSEVSRVCDILGLDPLFMSNEGKFLVAAEERIAEELVDEMRKDDAARDARVIGTVKEGIEGVILYRKRGGRRILRPPYGGMLPRVC